MSGIYNLLLKLKNNSFYNKIPDITYNLPLSSFNFCPKCGSISLKYSDKSIWCRSCDFVMYFNSSTAVAGLIIKEEEILFTVRKHDPEAGKLDLPGGFVDPGETAEKAIVREIKEELNTDVSRTEYITSLSNNYEYKGVDYNTLDMFFYCDIKKYDDLIPNDDVFDFEFRSIKKLDIENDIGLNSIKNLFRLMKELAE